MPRRSIGIPLTVGIALTIVALALGVGWQFIVVSEVPSVARGLTWVQWLLLVLGSVFFLLLVVGLVLLCAWLVREMRLNQRQQAFLDAVTHEMKTPLASLRLYVDTLGRHDPSGDRRRAFLHRMRGDLDRLDHTVDQVLAAARAEARARPSRRDPVELRSLLARSVAETCSRHGLPPEAVVLEDGPDCAVRGAAAELGVVFRNLLDNAVKYSDDPVEVRVRVRRDGDARVQVEITDRGIGIPARELRRIFQRFYRVGRDVQRKAAGLGLGLFIVRHLVRRQGGRVVAQSEGAGRGSRFLVTLRVAAAAARAGSDSGERALAEATAGGGRA